MPTVNLRESELDHRSFAALLPSERDAILRRVTGRLPWAGAELLHWVTSVTRRTYVVVRLDKHRSGEDEFVTWLVAFGDRVFFDSGNYGFLIEIGAVRDMYNRAF